MHLVNFRILIGVCWLLGPFAVQAQQITLQAENQPLNEVLSEIRKQYGVAFSFDDQLLAAYPITLSTTFSSPEEALAALLKDLPLTFEKSGQVFIIIPQHPAVREELALQQKLIGRITDALTGEYLPYSHLLVGENGSITDASGSFSVLVSPDSCLSVRVSHLGYYRLDTLLCNTGDHHLQLFPAKVGLKEVVVSQRQVDYSMVSRQLAGEVRLNHQVGFFLPGYADNALFNLLRLQPGVMAAGEQASDLIVWGSYSGQTGILFDGFTVYSLKNFNDNIGVVNPFMIQDIRLLKGAYPATYGGKAGGIVDITGKGGLRSKPSVNLSITNLIINGQASIPISERSSLHLAVRKTFYNLYRDVKIPDFLTRRVENNRSVDLAVTPDYRFQDAMVKYTGETRRGSSYYFDLLTAGDTYEYTAEYETGGRAFVAHRLEKNRFSGFSGYFGKTWSGGLQSDIRISGSGLTHHLDFSTRMNMMGQASKAWRTMQVFNGLQTLSVRQKNTAPVGHRHQLGFGFGLTGFGIALEEDSIGQNLISQSQQALSAEAFIQDQISLTPRLTLIPGVRLDYPLYLRQAFIQPRFSISYQTGEKSWLKAAWGRYAQYVVQSLIADELGNYRYFWSLSDGSEVPVQTANHYTLGWSYNHSWLTLGLDAYHKRMTGLTRYLGAASREMSDVYQGEGRMVGLDVMLDMRYKKHNLAVSYTLSRSLEHFDYFPDELFRRAVQDQRHELKVYGLANFNPLFVSSSFVYGSGYPEILLSKRVPGLEAYPYIRWDVSGGYQFAFRHFDLQVGLSVLNVLNRKNIRYQDYYSIPNSQGTAFHILAEALPLTPAVYLLISY